jgi:hypothetical protein
MRNQREDNNLIITGTIQRVTLPSRPPSPWGNADIHRNTTTSEIQSSDTINNFKPNIQDDQRHLFSPANNPKTVVPHRLQHLEQVDSPTHPLSSESSAAVPSDQQRLIFAGNTPTTPMSQSSVSTSVSTFVNQNTTTFEVESSDTIDKVKASKRR